MSTTVMVVLSVVAVVIIGIYQYESARTDMQYTDGNKALIIAKRVSLFILASVVAVLLILYAGGGGSSTPDWVPERRWEVGRG